MTVSVRLDRKTEALLLRLARERRRSKSAIIRDSIAALARNKLTAESKPKTAYELMKPYIGVVHSGGGLMAGAWKTRWTAHLRKKHFGENTR